MEVTKPAICLVINSNLSRARPVRDANTRTLLIRLMFSSEEHLGEAILGPELFDRGHVRLGTCRHDPPSPALAGLNDWAASLAAPFCCPKRKAPGLAPGARFCDQ